MSEAHQIHLSDEAIQSIATLTEAALLVKHEANASFAVVPKSCEFKDITKEIENANPTPNRKKGSIQLGNLDSFIKYCQAQHFNSTGGTVYCDTDKLQFTAVFNDHTPDNPGWRDYRAVYKAQLSKEFSLWQKHNEQPFQQESFAEFVEANIADIVEPNAEDLLKVALSLEATTTANFSSSRRLDNGQVQFQYVEAIDAKSSSGSIEIPKEFAIGVRIFQNSDAYRIKARLKYRLNSGQLKFWYELDRPHRAIEDCFKDYIEAAKESGLMVLIGNAD